MAYAYEQAGYDDASGDYSDANRRSGDGFQSSFGYVPQSLRGRSMLRGYMTPYGAAGFGPNPYDPWGSSFYHGYGAYNPGFIDPYNTWGSAGMGGVAPVDAAVEHAQPLQPLVRRGIERVRHRRKKHSSKRTLCRGAAA